MKISVAILTYNSSDLLDQVLAPLTWCDEIIIVDSFSTDNTLEIAEKYGAKIFQKKLIGFGEQKQYLVSKCSNDWILSIDSDEIVNDELKKSLIQFSHEDNPKFNVYTIKRRHVFLGKEFKYGKEKSTEILRLFNKNYAGFTNDTVHEKIETTSEIGTLNGLLLHYTVSNLNQVYSKTLYYAQLKADDYFSRNKKSSFLKLLFAPPFLFFKIYFIELNFLNGIEGLIWAAVNAYGNFIRYSLLFEKNYPFHIKK